MAGDSDIALVERALSGDESAFQFLMEPLDSDLRNFVRSGIRVRPEVDLEDVLQDLRVYLFSRLDRYNSEYPFRAFAFALAKQIIKRAVYAKSDLLPGAAGEEESGPHEIHPEALDQAPVGLSDAIGARRFSGPDRDPSLRFLQLLEAFLVRGGYPHQQVCFGFSILLWGKDKRKPGDTAATKVPVTGEPDRVVREIGPLPLTESVESMIEELQVGMSLEPAFINDNCEDLRARLAMTGRELFASDAPSRRSFERLLDNLTGDNQLKAYFGRQPPRSVADWTRTVKQRIRTYYEQGNYNVSQNSDSDR